MRYIGLDVHKNNTVACVISAGGKVVTTLEVRSEPNGLRAVHDYIGNDDYTVMMESSTYSYVVYRFFEALGIEAHVVHARSLKMITDTDKKTDRKDAESIGKMLRLWKNKEIDLSMAYMPTPEQCSLKDICRYREELSMKLGDEVRRIRSHMRRNCEDLPDEYGNLSTARSRDLIRRTWPDDYTLMRRLDVYSDLLKERDSVSREIDTRGRNNRNVELLADIPGIGRQTAVQIMSMVIDIDRFEDPEKLCAYFGMAPTVRDSGGKEHHGHMTKNGDRMMRQIMERVTLSHIRHCDSSVTAYFRRKEKEMGTKKALVTASRKMLAVIFAVLKRQRPFTA